LNKNNITQKNHPNQGVIWFVQIVVKILTTFSTFPGSFAAFAAFFGPLHVNHRPSDVQ